MSLVDQADRLLMDQNKPAYTPGPWTTIQAVRPHGSERSTDHGILDAHQNLIAECFEIVGYGTDETSRYQRVAAAANAKLIAAAPELVEALRLLTNGFKYSTEVCQIARTALAKAAL